MLPGLKLWHDRIEQILFSHHYITTMKSNIYTTFSTKFSLHFYLTCQHCSQNFRIVIMPAEVYQIVILVLLFTRNPRKLSVISPYVLLLSCNTAQLQPIVVLLVPTMKSEDSIQLKLIYVSRTNHSITCLPVK